MIKIWIAAIGASLLMLFGIFPIIQEAHADSGEEFQAPLDPVGRPESMIIQKDGKTYLFEYWQADVEKGTGFTGPIRGLKDTKSVQISSERQIGTPAMGIYWKVDNGDQKLEWNSAGTILNYNVPSGKTSTLCLAQIVAGDDSEHISFGEIADFSNWARWKVEYRNGQVWLKFLEFGAIRLTEIPVPESSIIPKTIGESSHLGMTISTKFTILRTLWFYEKLQSFNTSWDGLYPIFQGAEIKFYDGRVTVLTSGFDFVGRDGMYISNCIPQYADGQIYKIGAIRYTEENQPLLLIYRDSTE